MFKTISLLIATLLLMGVALGCVSGKPVGDFRDEEWNYDPERERNYYENQWNFNDDWPPA